MFYVSFKLFRNDTELIYTVYMGMRCLGFYFATSVCISIVSVKLKL